MEGDISQVLNNNGPMHQDFVPHIARISNLMKMKVLNDVKIVEEKA